eukprot:7385125-Prymnesium_polylepis.3
MALSARPDGALEPLCVCGCVALYNKIKQGDSSPHKCVMHKPSENTTTYVWQCLAPLCPQHTCRWHSEIGATVPPRLPAHVSGGVEGTYAIAVV